MPVERVPRLELPPQEPGEFTVTLGKESSWKILYKPSPWYLWSELQKEGVAEDGTSTNSKKLLKPIANKNGKKRIGVYEVIRGWRDTAEEHPHLFLYVGSAVPGSLRARVVNLVRLGTHAYVDPITNHAKKVLEENENPLLWLYIRWSRCEYQWEPVLLEYYLHLLREPCFHDTSLFPWVKTRESSDCAEWKPSVRNEQPNSTGEE